MVQAVGELKQPGDLIGCKLRPVGRPAAVQGLDALTSLQYGSDFNGSNVPNTNKHVGNEGLKDSMAGCDNSNCRRRRRLLGWPVRHPFLQLDLDFEQLIA